jgi:hypothetical protein
MTMKNKVVGVIFASILTCTGALAEEMVSKASFEALQSEVAELRDLLKANQAQTIEVVQKVEEQAAKPAPSFAVPEGFELGAVVEVEAGYASLEDDDESDIAVATVEVSAGWQLSDWLRADLVFLYEEGDTEFDVDQAIISIGNTEEFPLYLQLGQMFVPFGNFDSVFVSDPIALELAEALESAALVGFEAGGFSASVTVFNGDVETDGENQVENVVLAASYGIESDDSSLNFGASWIRNILDSDGLTGVLDDEFGYTYAADDIAGGNVWLTASVGPVTFIAEYVKVLDEIEVDGTSTGLEPESLNLELGFALSDEMGLGLKYEEANDVQDWLPEERMGVVCTYAFPETDTYTMGLALEYMHEEFENGDEGDVVTAQIALEF